MAWNTNPAPRADLLFEGLVALDGSGQYTSNWLDTAHAKTIRLAIRWLAGSGQVIQVEEAIFDNNVTPSGPRAVRTHTPAVTNDDAYTEIDLSARLFRFVLSGGPANDNAAVTIRVVE